MAGVIGLFWYCYLTYGIRKDTGRQTAASYRPFIVIDELKDEDAPNFRIEWLIVSESKIFVIRNLGTGPALDIKWKKGIDTGNHWYPLGDLAMNDWSGLPSADCPHMYRKPDEGLLISYHDLAGNKFETRDELKGKSFFQSCKSVKDVF